MQANNSNILIFFQTMKTEEKQNQKYGHYLKSLRYEAGLTQVELATRLDVAQSNIAFWENADKPPRADILKPLAEVLNVKVETLLKVEPVKLTRPTGKGKLAKAFLKASALSRRQQEKIADVVSALVNQANQ